MEQQLQEILDLSLDIHYYYDVSESRFIYVNPALKDHFGISPGELIGKDNSFLVDLIHPEDRESFENHWNNSCFDDQPNSKFTSSDYRYRTRSEKFIWYNDTHRFVRNKEGKVISIIGCLRDITDLKVVEILKSTTKERLNLAMEAASDSIWEWKVTSNRLFFDARFYSILDYEAYEFPDNFAEWEKRMHPEDRDKAFRLLRDCSTGKSENIHIEYRILSKTGHWKWLLCRAKVSGINDDGRIIKIIGTQTDITKLKEAEEEIRKHNIALQEAEKIIKRNSTALQVLYNNLKENEERLQLFFDETKNTAFIMLELKDNRLKVTEFSSGGENIFGIQKKDVLHKNFQEIFENSPNRHFYDLIRNLNDSNEEFKGEIPVHRQNGEYSTCLLTIHFTINEKTGNKKILTILTDIQQRKEFEIALRIKNEELIAAEEKLKATNEEIMYINGEIQRRNIELRKINEKLIESEEKFRELAENTHDAFWLRDEKQFLYTNPSFEKLWGRNGDQISGIQEFENLIHPEDRSRYFTWKHLSSFAANINYSEQFRIIKADGSVRWLWSRIHPVFNSEGNVYRVAGIATDITEVKETEQALLRAKEKAMESDNLKSAFLANISHEIRTPMNGILGFIELLKDDSISRDTREQYINIISKSSKQLLQIINDIIDISKIEANQLSIDIKECNINLITRDIYLFYQKDNLAVKKGMLDIRLESGLSDDQAMIFTDESRLRQILMNILDNAVKFTSEGEIVMGYRLADNHTVEFYIRDTGIGIPKNQYHLVFERFRQVDGSATRKYGGTGLGLSISQGLAKLLGGSISFDSEEGKGTQFFVTLPYQPVTQPFTEPDDKLNDLLPDWENKSILIVEDDEINYELLKTMLEFTKAGIVRAESGEDAIRLFSDHQNISLILMDIRLPGINGYQVLKSIKEQNPVIPVIAQTAFAMAEDNRKCLEQGFDDYISKPINRKLLLKIIQKQFNESNL